MESVLSSPTWQGIGVIATLILGFIGFYYAGRQKIWLYISGATVLGIISFSLGVQLSSSSPTTRSPLTTAVDATRDWQPTGFYVERGDTVSIRVTGGRWTTSRGRLIPDEAQKLSEAVRGLEIWVNYTYENSGEGIANLCPDFGLNECPVPSAPIGSLVARIGIEAPLFVGNARTFTVPDSGELYLRINDGFTEGIAGLNDNFGVLSIEIRK